MDNQPSTPAAGRAVCAVVVAFHPGPEVRAILDAIVAQVGKLVVVDNESTPESRALLTSLDSEKVELIFNPRNLGVATALNQGVRRALDGNYDWLATFDQDSVVPPGYVAGLLSAWEQSPAPARVAVVAPLYRDRGLGFLFSPGGPLGADVSADVYVPVTATSGNLVSAAALREVGGFCEEYFIDCVDFEFCLRCRRAGWRILEVRRVLLDHAAGRWQQRRWLGKNSRFNDYGADRRYYQARNRVFLYRTFAGFDLRWIRSDAWGYLCDVIKLVLFCADRPKKIASLLQGIRHGLDGRTGPRRRERRGDWSFLPQSSRFAAGMISGKSRRTVLHYTGYRDDAGGIVTLVRNLAGVDRFDCVLGVSTGCVQHRQPPLPALELPEIEGERIGPVNFWRARRTARVVQAWLQDDVSRLFHGHSRAGLLVALWLAWWGERRIVASVHCYGRQRWFYRWAARRLGARIFWLSPAMRAYYGVAGDGWARCIPGGVPVLPMAPSPAKPGVLRLGGIGALVPWKCWRLVLEAVSRLPESVRSRITFEHIGGGDEQYRQELLRLAADRGLGSAVRFCGPEASSARLLREIDVLVVASANEPCSMAMLEALAAGVPVITADSGGALDIVKYDVNGRLFRTGDAEALCDVIAGWLSAPPKLDAATVRATTVPAGRVAGEWESVYDRL